MRKWPALFSLLSACVLLTSCSPCSNEKSAKPREGEDRVKALPAVSEPGRKIPGQEIHVSPTGNDADAGSAEKPLATIQKAITLVAGKDAPREIIIHKGTYPGGIEVGGRDDKVGGPPKLVIRAAKDKNGKFEDVIIDGGQKVNQVESVPDNPGVYKIPTGFSERSSASMWEVDTRTRYFLVADINAVKKFPASFVFTKKEIYFHTPDSKPPQGHEIGFCRDASGISASWSNITVQGIQFRNFLLDRGSAGITLKGNNQTVEDCRAWNCMRSFTVGEVQDARVLRCRGDDVGCGVLTYGKNTIVEDCMFFRKHDNFIVHLFSQDQSGIEFLYQAVGGEARRNLCVGFNLGVFFKCTVSRFIVEFNTVVSGENDQMGSIGIGCTQWSPESAFRYNIVAGYNDALIEGEAGVGIPPGTVVDKNCFWEPEGGDKMIKELTKKGIGSSNVNVEPKFINPAQGDYRLLPGSPGTDLSADKQKGIGALGISDGKTYQPAIAPVADSILSSPAPVKPVWELAKHEVTYVKREGPARVWYVDPDKGKDNPLVGTEKEPLLSLQIALNHANPGDKVVLLPGIYAGQHILKHGGAEKAPITIEAAVVRTAVLDGVRQVDNCLTLENAPNVVIKGLEVRWFRETGISITNSPHVSIQYCTFWNQHWSRVHPSGYGIRAQNSEALEIDHNVFFAMGGAFILQQSPSSRLTYNTAAKLVTRCGNLWGGSAADSVCRNNSFTFTGNRHLNIGAKTEELKTFDCDYNNLAMYVREIAERRPAPEDDIKPFPGDFFNGHDSKGLNTLNGEMYQSLKEWQEKTGLDKHSIYKHPRYADPLNRDFRLKPDSPNIGAGENGTNIGALEVVK